LAGGLMTVLATLVVTYLAEAASCYANVAAADPGGEGCLHGVPVRRLGTRAHFIIVQATIVAAPALLVVGGLGWLRRRPDAGAPTPGKAPEQTPEQTPEQAPSRLGAVAVGVTLSLLVVVLAGLSVLVMPTAYRLWLELAFG
jgi:hypothetical protein